MQVLALEHRVPKLDHGLAQRAVRKLSLPWLQNGTKSSFFMLPAIRSGRSERKRVTGLNPRRVSRFRSASKAIICAVWAKRKSACASASCAAAARPASSAAWVTPPAARACQRPQYQPMHACSSP